VHESMEIEEQHRRVGKETGVNKSAFPCTFSEMECLNSSPGV